MLGLIQQVSTKNYKNSDGQTGKFGTGFIGTYFISKVIDIEGILHIKDNHFMNLKCL